jgi:hypothetical protein
MNFSRIMTSETVLLSRSVQNWKICTKNIRARWLTPIIPGIQEVESRRITV